MDFKYHYTAAQESFRGEVASWLDANLDPSLDPVACRYPSTDDWPFLLRLRHELGANGWLHPQASHEQGGIGATQGEEVVLAEELERRGLGWLQDRRDASLLQALDRWSSPGFDGEVAGRLGRGEILVWHTPFDPEVPPLPPDIDLQAEEDGDDYVLNGESRFAGMGPEPDLLWAIARLGVEPSVEDPGTQPVVCCVVQAHTVGITCRGDGQPGVHGARPVAFDNVLVPRYCVLGEPGAGVGVMAAAFASNPAPPAPLAVDSKAEETHRYLLEMAMANPDPYRQQTAVQAVMDSYVESRVARLFRLRNAHVQQQGGKLTYHGAQSRLWERRVTKRLAEVIDHVAGPYALLDRQDPRGLPGGGFPSQFRFDEAWEGSLGHWLNDRHIIACWLGMGPAVAAHHQKPGIRAS